MGRILSVIITVILLSVNVKAQTAITHTVKKGESFYGIAKKYGVSVELLKQANPNMGNYFHAGMTLNIPTKIDSNDLNEFSNDSVNQENFYNPPEFYRKIEETKIDDNSSDNRIKDITNYGLMYWGFDGYENYGVFAESTTYNNVGVEMAGRTKFEKHSNYNWELGLNYSFGIFREEKSALMLTASFCPISVRTQEEYNYKSDKYQSKTYFDAYYSLRLSLKLGCVDLTGGYFYWAPKWEFGKDYKIDGFCIGLMYSTKKQK